MSVELENQLKEFRAEIDRLTGQVDEWRKAAFEVTRQATETRARLTEERDIWKADFEKVVGYNTKKQELLEKAEAELEQVKRELEQAIAERTPHDYGILKDQRDAYRDRLCASIKETKEARTEVEQLKWDYEQLSQKASSRIKFLEEDHEKARVMFNQLTNERDEARAEVERLKRQSVNAVTLSWSGPRLSGGGGGGGSCAGNDHHVPAATKMIRPEPSRLEIAAMILAAFAGAQCAKEKVNATAYVALKCADELLAEAAKGGAK